MSAERLNDMLERYGECCTQIKAAKILGRHENTIADMLKDGRLKRACAGSMVDVRSICEYIETPDSDRGVRLNKRREKMGVSCRFAVR